MKVILKQDIKGLGKAGDMVNVKDGYARNLLIPKSMAVEATSTNINIMNTKKEAEKTKKDREYAKARGLSEKIKGLTVVIKTKSGENGKLFGSISSKDIADQLKRDFGIDVDKKKIMLHDALRTLCTMEVDVKLCPDVSAKLNVKVERE